VLSNAEFIQMILNAAPEAGPYVMLLLALFECLTMTLCTISAGSVSVEGKGVWLMQAMPVKTKDVLMSKALLQLVITLPFVLIATVLTWLGGKASIAIYAASLLLPLSFAVMMSLLGVAVNVRFPRLDWTSEAVAVKQGMSILADMGAGLGLLATPVAVWALWLSSVIAPEVGALILAALYAGVSALLYVYLGRSGSRRFEAL